MRAPIAATWGGLACAVTASVALGGDAARPPLVPDPAAAGPAKAYTVDFEGKDVKERALPEGFAVLDGGWAVIDDPTKPGKNRVLLQEKTVPDYAVVLSTGEGRACADGKSSVRFFLVSGKDDAAAGIVFRAQGAGDYYLCRANALEDNFRLYVVKGGVRWQLESVTVKPPAIGEWHTLEVEFRGDAFRAVLDGKDVVAAKDKSFASAGWCGLWTKADAVTRFDDLVVTPDAAKKETPPGPPAPPSPPDPEPPPEGKPPMK